MIPFLDRLKKRYKYAHWYLGYRVWKNFSAAQRRGFREMASQVETFRIGRLFALGNEGVLYDGVYKPVPSKPHILKLALMPPQRYEAMCRVQENLARAPLGFLCEMTEFGLSKRDPAYGYQVQPKIEGMGVSRYLLLPVEIRAAVYDPVRLCIEFLEQARALNAARIVAPNIDAENLIIGPDRVLRWIDLDPYRAIEDGTMPLFTLRRVCRLVLAVLSDHANAWRLRLETAPGPCARETFESLLRRLRQSSLYGYDHPRRGSHRFDHRVDPRECYTSIEEPLEILKSLDAALQLSARPPIRQFC